MFVERSFLKNSKTFSFTWLVSVKKSNFMLRGLGRRVDSWHVFKVCPEERSMFQSPQVGEYLLEILKQFVNEPN